MTYQALPSTWWWPASNSATTYPSTTDAIVDADAEGYGCVFTCPYTDSIEEVAWLFSTITTGGDIHVAIVTVDTATYLPTTSLFGTNTEGTFAAVTGDANTFKSKVLTSAASVTAGDLVGITLTRPAAGTFNGRFKYPSTSYVPLSAHPRAVTKTSASWSGNQNPIGLAVKFTSAGWAQLEKFCLHAEPSAVAFSTSSTPDIYGNVFTPTVNMKANKVCLACDADSDGTVKVFDTDGVTVLASASVPATIGGTTGATVIVVYLSSTVTLTAGSTYRVTYESNGVGNVSLHAMNFGSYKGQSPYCALAKTSAKDPTGVGSWTNSTTECYSIFLGISHLDDGSGGGGLAANPVGGFIA